jgi:NAD(P)-dependent dehydrogenase (short-subunit alcohol dehydrogenase family)
MFADPRKSSTTGSTGSLVKELSERGIRVNSVAPGPTRTRLRAGDDIGKVIAALLSDECAWITGENIEASGGFNL